MSQERKPQISKLKLPSKTQAMMVCKQIKIRKNQVIAFVACTFDKKAFLIDYWKQLQQFKYQQLKRRSQQLISDVFFDQKEEEVFVGTIGGDIEGWKLKDQGCSVNKNQPSFLYKQKNDKYMETIILIYCQQVKLITWDIQSQIRVISRQSKEILCLSRIKAEISATLAIKDPFSGTYVACIAFQTSSSKKNPPIIFSNPQKTGIKSDISNSQKYFKEQQHTEEGTITLITTDIHRENNKILVCSSIFQNENYINVYGLIKEQKHHKIVCEPIYRISVDLKIIHMSLSSDILVLSQWEKIEFLQLSTRKWLMNFSKKSKYHFVWAFPIQCSGKNIIFILERGFNCYDNQNSKKSAPKLKTCQMETSNLS